MENEQTMNEWMNGWMDEYMNEWIYEWMNGLINYNELSIRLIKMN